FDAEVAQSPLTSLVIDRPTVLYLVVNDTTCDRSDPVTHAPVDVGGLTVSLTRLTPVAGAAKQLQPALTATYSFVQSQISTKLLPQKMILPSDLSTIRSQAASNLAQQCNFCDLTAFDRNLMTFYNAFIDTALNQAERQVEIARLEDQ